MRRRALLAASAASGNSGGEEPLFPEGFFPLYLYPDYCESLAIKVCYINSSDTTRQLLNILLSVLDKYGIWSNDNRAVSVYDISKLGIELYINDIKVYEVFGDYWSGQLDYLAFYDEDYSQWQAAGCQMYLDGSIAFSEM